jgi:hypothetical protein
MSGFVGQRTGGVGLRNISSDFVWSGISILMPQFLLLIVQKMYCSNYPFL